MDVLRSAHSQHQRFLRTASSKYARPSRAAVASTSDICATWVRSEFISRPASASHYTPHLTRYTALSLSAPKNLHHEDFPSKLAERLRRFFREYLEHPMMLARDLRAHRVRRHFELRIGIQAVDERLDRRDVIRIERIEADLNCSMHVDSWQKDSLERAVTPSSVRAQRSNRSVTPTCLGSPSCV